MHSPSSERPPARFVEALESIRAVRLPNQAVLEEIPAPVRAAAFAVAIETRLPGPADTDHASGSFVLLHEPDGHAVWDGDFRIVTAARAELEPELGADPFLAEVAWSYLAEALEMRSLAMKHLAGTVTRTLSESFGGLKMRGASVGVEVRASWTPNGADVGHQLVAWIGFLAKLGGVELLPDHVIPLHPRRHLL
ncbi:MAG: DUF3000 domain-containing protein [Bifidobacteriaceae bacterium]|jgi:hypothetical protein|nr:DUF3000 domain-containing protein [Bifidobacteriaceae bacterium]